MRAILLVAGLAGGCDRAPAVDQSSAPIAKSIASTAAVAQPQWYPMASWAVLLPATCAARCFVDCDASPGDIECEEADGSIEEAKIVPPTSQNQARVEQDLREFVRPRVDLSDERLRWECEQAIRNYDPCISCSTHFLKLEVDR